MKLFMREDRWHWLWWGGVSLLFALTFLLAPIKDPDFFWHLHTGQWIWENRALPTIDPFSVAGGTSVNARQYFILTSYWLAQLFYYGIYALFGWSGFFIVRAVIFWLLVRAMLMRRHVWPLGYAVLVAASMVLIFARFPVERPQFLSFLFFAAVTALLDRLAEAREVLPRQVVWGLPVLMLAWGNIHGGVLLGQILCGAHLLNNGWRGFTGEISWRFFRRTTVVLAGAVLLSLVTPNWANYLAAHQESLNPKYQPFFEFNLEYRSLYQLIVVERLWIYGFFPVLALLAGYGLVREGVRKNLMYIVLTACFAFFAFKNVRYLPFLGILVLPFAGNVLVLFGKRIGMALVLALFIGGVAGSYQHFDNIRSLARNGLLSPRYPQRAVEFVKQNGLRGNLLNDYEWGGYLGWALGAGHNVFVDGRTLDIEKYNDWLLLYEILGSAEKGAEKHIDYFGKRKILDHILSKYKIDYMILPKIKWGSPFWLSVTLADHPGWNAVYDDRIAVVFVRNGQ
jgi:hypothetical protein